MSKNSHIQQILESHIKATNISCRTMAVTLFGDCVSQHGGWVWLGSLIEALAPFGFNERSVRTAVYRLVQSEWLEVKKVGRKSYYCFSESAKSHYERAARKIYIAQPLDWNGKWLLVLPVSIPEDKKEEFRKSLIWQGFNTFANGIYAHPSSDRRSLDEMLVEQMISKDVAIFSATTEDLYSHAAIKGLVNKKWGIVELELFYQNFLDFYRALKTKASSQALSPKECFLLRTALLHDYRRIQLRDPDLPSEILPNGWVGYEAQDLLKRMYKMLVPSSLQYVEQHLFNAHGPLPSASTKFFGRFGGLN